MNVKRSGGKKVHGSFLEVYKTDLDNREDKRYSKIIPEHKWNG